jgi:uncharacterized protein (TIGR02246 family)
MKRMSLVLLAVALALAAGCGPKTNAPDDVAALKAMEDAYVKAVNAGDAAGLAALYVEDAVRMVSNMPAIKGREAIRAFYQSDFDLFANEETNAVEDIQVRGDLAVVRGTYASKAVPRIAGPAVIEDTGKWVAVSRRQDDGSWKFLFDASNTDLPAGRIPYPDGADEKAILKIEMDWAAALQRNDAAALEPMMADTFAENRGGVLTKKKDILAGLKSARSKPDSVEVGDLRIMVFGEFGVVNGRGVVKETVRGKEVVETFRFIDTFQKQDGAWKAVSAFLVPEK